MVPNSPNYIHVCDIKLKQNEWHFIVYACTLLKFIFSCRQLEISLTVRDKTIVMFALA